jgi:hypothetical protein
MIPEEIEAMAIDFYGKLFTAQTHTEPSEVVQFVPRKVTDAMNDMMNTPFSDQEVTKALFMMHPNKVLGSDGFTARFYQKHLYLIKEDLTRAVLQFLNGGDMPELVNNTVLALIPKVKNPQELSNFRPIALCNMLYKICCKAITNRLRQIISDIIFEERTTLILGRLIMDNTLIAYESIHYLKRKKGKSRACAVKLDMAKAYDRVEWSYFRCIMLKLGFSGHWVELIMRCVESMKLSVRINGFLSEAFSPSRGIRQGDFLSHYLFLLCAEGLSSLLNHSGPQFLSKGIRVGIHAPWISHLLFPDYFLVFTQANDSGDNRLKEILLSYHKGSGQMVNMSKSAILFSSL